MHGVIIFYSSFRPTAEKVFWHCLFWSKNQQLDLFVGISEYIYKDKKSPTHVALNKNSSSVYKGDWKTRITSDLKSSDPKELKSIEYLNKGQ